MAQRTSDETTGGTSAGDTGLAGVEPPYLYPDYKGTRLRAPKEPLVIVPRTLSKVSGPAYGRSQVGPLDHDLTHQYAGEPLGERIIVHGRVLDDATGGRCGTAS